jgi:hypothetical protein
MAEDINQPESYSELKSFKPYLGKKAPVLIQIIAGIMWLGAAGVILNGISDLIFNPIFGVITILIGIFAIIAGKSLFGMKKSAVRNSIIMAVLFAGIALWSIISTKFTGGLGANRTETMLFLYAALLVLIVLKYKSRFIN